MRIAQVLTAGAHPDSGVPAVIEQLAIHLAQRGHQLEVWLLQADDVQHQRHLVRRLSAADIALVNPRGRWWRRLGVLAQRDVDLVHLHSVFSLPNALLARQLRMPYVLSPHGGYAPASRVRSALRKRLFARLFERRLLRDSALPVALTAVEAADLAAFGARQPVTVIPNGVLEAPVGTDGGAFRREVGLSGGELLLLFVGRLDVFHKGLDLLVRGLAGASEWHAALVGPDFRGGVEWLAREARRVGVDDRLHMVGPRRGQALHEAFAAADCFALTSRWEGLPLSLLEALAHGVPAVVSPTVDRTVDVTGAGAGWSTNHAELGELLSTLARLDAAEWTSRRAGARVLAGRYDWASVALQYEAAYAVALGRHTRQ